MLAFSAFLKKSNHYRKRLRNLLTQEKKPKPPHWLIEYSVPQAMDTQSRVEMTCSCQDAERIPKVSNAGQVFHSPDGESVQLMHNGLKVLVDGYYGSWMTEIITRCKGHHEPQEELVFYEVLKRIPEKSTMIEVGGYWVYYSLWFLQQYPTQRQAFAIEPDPKHIEIGLANCRLNDSLVNFTQGFIGKDHGQISQFHTESSGIIAMPSVSIQGLMKEKKLEHVDLILCDAQGGELAMLESLEELVKNNQISFVIVSTHHAAITGDPLTHERCLSIIKGLGGQILAEHDVQESYSGDGLIAAKFGEPIIDWTEPPLSRNRYSTSFWRNPLIDLALLKS